MLYLPYMFERILYLGKAEYKTAIFFIGRFLITIDILKIDISLSKFLFLSVLVLEFVPFKGFIHFI